MRWWVVWFVGGVGITGGYGSFDPPVGVMFPWVFWLLSHLTGGTGGFVARPSMYVMCVGFLLLIIFFIESW